MLRQGDHHSFSLVGRDGWMGLGLGDLVRWGWS